MTEPIEEDLKRSRRSREAIYRQMANEAEENPKTSSSKGTLKGKSVRPVEDSDKNVANVFKRVTKPNG